jgi:GNAT superfamily N-acetyltransferase
MKYRKSTSKDIKAEKIDALQESIGWQKRGDIKWKECLAKSFFVYSVWDQDKLIGLGRILEDGTMCIFYDIMVHKDYQGQGIGKMIVGGLVDEIKNKDYHSINLFMDNESLKTFYGKFGFKPLKTGMECKQYMKKYPVQAAGS